MGMGRGVEVTFTIIQMGKVQLHCLSPHYCTDVRFFQLGMHLCRREIFKCFRKLGPLSFAEELQVLPTLVL